MTPEDIKNVTFERAMRGYRPEDVDSFLGKAAQSLTDMTAERDAALDAVRKAQEESVRVREESDSKMMILAQKVEEYRGMEDTLKTALINAQRMGETVVHEAKQKADSMLRDATGKAELLRQRAEQESLNEQLALEKLQSEVTRFKATVLNLYKQHIESLSALDAPVVRVEEFLQENGYEPLGGEGETEGEVYAEEEIVGEVITEPAAAPAPPADPANFGTAEPEVPDNKTEAAQAAGIETTPPEPENAPQVNLFEGALVEPGPKE